jgi:hypothetical protein
VVSSASGFVGFDFFFGFEESVLVPCDISKLQSVVLNIPRCGPPKWPSKGIHHQSRRGDTDMKRQHVPRRHQIWLKERTTSL